MSMRTPMAKHAPDDVPGQSGRSELLKASTDPAGSEEGTPMDLSELGAGPGAFEGLLDLTPRRYDQAFWQDLVTLLGGEIAGPLTGAIERVNAMLTDGKVDRQGLRSLRDEIESARRSGMVVQQLARFATGRVRPSHEPLALADLVREALVQRQRELQQRGLPVRQALQPVRAEADASLLFGLLNALVDWCAEHARSTIDLRLDLTPWPVQARLTCRFAYKGADDAHANARSLDSLSWHLAQQTAWTMGLDVQRDEAGIETTAAFTFPRTLLPELDRPAGRPRAAPTPTAQNSRPLAGSHLLVLAPRRDVRNQVREAIHAMGMIVDFVTSVDEARELCDDALPHAVVYEATIGGARLDQWRRELRAEVPGLVFIEIVEQGDLLETSGHNGAEVGRVGRDGLREALPAALVYELSQGL